ncbi:MAG: superoxide dismutase [Sulfurovum sp.]|uniref:superoxide dismutase n=1 Tax=Sulfurovum sp. TaxID=1969726 RepID=UPI003C75B083
MTHTLMDLPFDESALEPYISKETLQYHHGKHHAGYINKLNTLIKDTKYEDLSLEEIVKTSDNAIFNNAAQVFNHNFYFNGMSKKISAPSKDLLELFINDFGSFEAFKEFFLEAAEGFFGSGWLWLSIDDSGSLVLESFSNAGNPLLSDHTPLMTCDVWEHAYYIDNRNARAVYLDKWWGLINWNFVSQNLQALKQKRLS